MSPVATLGMGAAPGSPWRAGALATMAAALLVSALAALIWMSVIDTDDGGDAAAPLLDRTRLTPAFDEEFARAPSFYDPLTAPHGKWKTNYWFGVQQAAAAKGWEPRTLVPNGEMQYYGDPALGMSPFAWSGGVLTIAARPNPWIANPVTNKLPYLSGLITTEKSFALTYGYFEARIAFPSGKGIWPAFWLLPVPKLVKGAPQSPGTSELDIFESIGEPGKLYFTYFPTLPNNRKAGNGKALETGRDLNAFHTYGALVTPQYLAWYFDGEEVRRVPNKDFHQPLYMLLNLAIGGTWPGKPAADMHWPAEMRIDWVRAYRLKPR